MDTLFSYIYRDAGNYKFHKNVILKGVLILEDIGPYLYEHEFFVPSEIGLIDLQPEILTIDDHIWHEVTAIEETEMQPNSTISSTELKNNLNRKERTVWRDGLKHQILLRRLRVEQFRTKAVL